MEISLVLVFHCRMLLSHLGSAVEEIERGGSEGSRPEESLGFGCLAVYALLAFYVGDG